MKKLLLLLLLPVFGFGQPEINSTSLILTDVFPIYSAYGGENIRYTVPENKLWYISKVSDSNLSQDIVMRGSFTDAINNASGNFYDIGDRLIKYETYLPQGVTVYFSPRNSGDANHDAIFMVYEFTVGDYYDSVMTVSSNNNSITPTLFPNPTSSLLALNSDKEYDIEVYDMSGNKLMALTGNAINMEHLSTATYIVKATDKSNNEELTYKVVKN